MDLDKLWRLVFWYVACGRPQQEEQRERENTGLAAASLATCRVCWCRRILPWPLARVMC
jgi:hypothetical protein